MISFFACNREKINLIKADYPVTSTVSQRPKPIQIWIFTIEFNWRGFGNGCYCPTCNCGGCPGFCAYTDGWIPNNQNNELTENQRAAGFGKGEVGFDPEDANKLVVIPDRSIDNGDGKVRVEEDFSIGAEASSVLGYSNVIVKQGEYEIDYSGSENFGAVVLDVEVID